MPLRDVPDFDDEYLHTIDFSEPPLDRPMREKKRPEMDNGKEAEMKASRRFWLEDRDLFIDMMLAREHPYFLGCQAHCNGRGCNSSVFPFRCRDCLFPLMLCKSCIVAEHGHQPFHRIEVCSDPRLFRIYLTRPTGVERRVLLSEGKSINAWPAHPTWTPVRGALRESKVRQGG